MADEKKAETVSATAKNSRKDSMRAMAAQATSNAPNIASRLDLARQHANENPLKSTSVAPGQSSDKNGDAVRPASTGTTLATDDAGAKAIPHVATTRGHFENAPLILIDENPFNARKTYRDARIKEMAASMAAHGQEVPGIATIRNGRYVLAAGHYRLKGLRQLEAPYMGLMVIPNMTDKQLYEMSYRENAEREDQTAWDNALAWMDLLDKKVYLTEQELGEAVGMSKSNVTKTLASLRLSESVREIVAADPSRFPLSVIYQLALFEPVGGTDKTVEFAKGVVDDEIGRKEIEEARARLADPQQRKTREKSRQYEVKVGDAGGFLKEFPNGKVTFEVNIPDAQARANFVEGLRKQYEA